MALTEQEAYLAMFHFLEEHYRRGFDELGVLLGSLSLLPDGSPADPAYANDWKAAVEAAVRGRVDAKLELKK